MNSDVIILDSDDGMASAGETLDLSVPIYNYGQSPANNLSAFISSESDYVTINSGTVYYGTIAPGQESYEEFNVTISPAAIQGEDLQIIINIDFYH